MIVESKDEIKVNLEKVKFTKKLEKKIIKKLKKRLWELAKEYCRLKHGNILFLLVLLCIYKWRLWVCS